MCFTPLSKPFRRRRCCGFSDVGEAYRNEFCHFLLRCQIGQRLGGGGASDRAQQQQFRLWRRNVRHTVVFLFFCPVHFLKRRKTLVYGRLSIAVQVKQIIKPVVFTGRQNTSASSTFLLQCRPSAKSSARALASSCTSARERRTCPPESRGSIYRQHEARCVLNRCSGLSVSYIHEQAAELSDLHIFYFRFRGH